jgi:2',3'-cyclic-nucleotide 2'-phosphodiesterase (5'-nucleotidase family)
VQLLNEVPEISAIITGHLHRGLPAPLEREGRVLVRAKGYAEELGRLDMLVDPSKKKMIQWNWTPVPVAPKTREAPDVAEQVKRWEAEVARQVDVPIGESSRQFSKAETREFIVEAMCRELGTDFAFVNAGGVRDILPKGRVLARHVWNIMPFDNRAVVGRFKGNQLPLSVTQGRNVDPNREYTLATTDFTAVNQSAPGELGSKGLMFPQEGPLLRDLLIDYIKKQKRVGDSAATPGAASRPD